MNDKVKLMFDLADGCRQYGDFLLQLRDIMESHDNGHICDETAVRMFKNAVENQLTED